MDCMREDRAVARNQGVGTWLAELRSRGTWPGRLIGHALDVVSYDIGYRGWGERDEGLIRDSACYGISPAGEDFRRNTITACQVDHTRACPGLSRTTYSHWKQWLASE